jgi:RHS repeat-associated protein
MATILAACANETTKVSQEGVCAVDADSVVAISVDTIRSERETTTTNVIATRELQCPQIKLPVTPTDSASVSLMGATLSVPLGAVEKEVTLSITALNSADIAKLPQGMVNVTRNAAGFRFLPHGKHFSSKDAHITLPIDTLAIPRGYTNKDVFVYFYDEERKRWTALARDTANHDRQLACALTSHFTDMIAGVLQVPEMPETQGFVPTAMSDVKAADPLQGIISVQAPQAVQSGAATISYPIATPAGRNGMQPNLALTYNSEGRSGWCGYGWSLQTPTIDIDTRWGVPRFDEKYETEIYIINGEQTTLQPHRSPESIERTAEREFFPRVENAFSKIIRHGNSPKNYWWEVTTKDGIVYTYKDVVKNDDGNIVHWSLSKVEEPHGDNVTYTYTEKNGYLYLTEIRYTNHNTTQGVYSVKITLAEGTKNIRRDITTSYRLGMLQTDSEQLGEIAVYYKNELLARYVPTYESGALRKTILTSITQYDGDGKDVGVHKFDYYNDVKDGLFGEAETWNIGNDEALEGKVIDRIGMTDGLSAIGGSRSTGTTNGGGAMVGVGASPIPNVAAALSVSAGFSKSFSHSWAHSDVSMTDIDGDGRPDKVFVDDDKLYYRKNISKNGKIAFAEPVRIEGANRMSLSESKTNSTSFNIGAGLSIGNSSKTMSFGLGGGFSKDESRTWDWTHSYMQDFNGDGLVDIAEKGVVLFNHIGDDGRPYFTKSSETTPNPVWTNESVAPSEEFQVDTAAERREQERQNPLIDAVRLWQAPYTGQISVAGAVSLTSPTNSTDGVYVTIQQNDNEKWHSRLTKSKTTDSHNLRLTVKAGDKIMFRQQSVYSGKSDATAWSPTITYEKCDSITTETRYDSNGEDRKTYSATNDFLHAGGGSAVLIGSGAKIEMAVNKPQMRDDVTLILTDNRGNTVWSKKFAGAEVVNTTETIRPSMSASDTLFVSARVDSRVPLDWKNLDWTIRTVSILDGELDTMYIAPEIERMYNRTIRMASAQELTDNAKPQFDFKATETDSTAIDKTWKKQKTELANAIFDDELRLIPYIDGVRFLSDTVKTSKYALSLTSVAEKNVVFADTTGTIENGNTKQASLPLALDNIGKELWADFYVDNEIKTIGKTEMHVGRWTTLIYTDTYIDTTNVAHGIRREERQYYPLDTIAATLLCRVTRQELGSLYRGWGQFAWNDTTETLIKTSKLKYDESKYSSINTDNLSDDDISSLTDEADSPLMSMAYDAEHKRWVSVKDSIYVAANEICTSRQLESEIVVEAFDYSASGYAMNAMRMRTLSESEGKSGYGSLSIDSKGTDKFGGNGGYGHSTGNTTVRTYQSIIDLNGDRYPDWLTNIDGQIGSQYTRQDGAMGDVLKKFDLDVVTSEGESTGNSVSGSITLPYAVSKSDNKTSNSKHAIHAGDAARVGGSVNGSISENSDETINDWTDINGDGLPDILFNDGSVRFNIGYGFTERTTFGHKAIRKGSSETKGFGGGFSIPICSYASLSGGVSYSRTDNETDATLMDVDGDGLPDMVVGDKVYFNNGSGFETSSASFGALLTYGRSVAKVANGSFAAGYAFPVWFISITPSVSYQGSGSTSFNRTERQLMDIDGDGVADIVESDENSKVTVSLGKIGRTNLLRCITSPLGATTTVEYDRAGNTYDLPQSRWVMSKVTTQGGDKRNGATRFATAFEYNDGYYDRKERDFFGFGEVKSTQLDTENSDAPYRTTAQKYDNRTYETRNLVTETTTTTSDGNLINKTENTYAKKSVHDGKSTFVAPSQTKTTTYEGTESLSITENYAYDERGNVVSYTSTTPNDSYTTEIKYHSLDKQNIYTCPSDVKVSADGKTVRHTTSQVNSVGDLTQINQIADGVTATFDMERDEYGNVTKLTRPQNANGQRFFRSYTYDNTHHTLVTSVTDAFGYSSSTEYDLKWCAPTKLTDINGNEMLYTYDSRGRLTSVSAPYEIEAGGQATISIEYDDKNHVAKTTNYDAKTQNSIVTYLFTDNLGRATQTKKSGIVDGKEVMIASGVVKFDAFGRKIAEGQPVTDNTTALNTSEILNPTLTEYDAQDRLMKVTLPDGTSSTAAYSIVEDYLKTVQTDANGHVTDSYKDIRGKDRKTVQHADGQEIETSFYYNAIGELLSVIHPNKEITTYEYDGLGRKTSVNHPDAGLTTFEYDAAGNMTAKQTPNLRTANGKIQYTYDYERLSEIIYPKNIYNRVTYTYGDTSETKYNRAGRLKLVEDCSGGEAYYYGKLGEVTKTIKSIILAETNIRTYIWEADYDSWNRVQTMTYPDGEVVSYTYDKGGNLNSITAEKDGDKQTLIAEQRFDKYGNLTYRKMGNGTETTYNYDEKRLHLNTMSLTSNGVKMMENVYKYDNVDNILGISNAAAPTGEIGGTYSHSYQYDELNRLVSASGTAKDKNYELLMRYDLMSNPLQKDSVSYEYNTPNHPNAVSSAGNKLFTYDANGNPISVEDTAANTLRVMQWDEENRLQSLGDDGYVSRYTYNHAGERVIKSHGPTTVAFVNGAPQGILWHDKDNWTMYVSPYMVVNADRFTKHYYAGSQRIASKIGAGEFNNLYDASKACVTAGQKDYAERLNQITESRNDYYAALGIPPGPPTAKGIYGEAEYSGAYGDYSVEPLGNYDVPSGWPMKPYKRPYGGTPGAPVMYEKPSDPEDEGAGYGYTNAENIQEKDIYFYHSDHLGSTSYITDANGNVTQFVCYKPYGEALVDEHNTSYEQPWKFNGKELDSETGLYYYGARYYEPVLALWYGVDALTEKYPSMGGYVYCAGNPVRLVDLDGNGWYSKTDESGNTQMVYDRDINSDMDLYDKHKEGTFRGLIYETENTYYSLFGQEIDKQESLESNVRVNKAELTKKIDLAIYFELSQSKERVDFSGLCNWIESIIPTRENEHWFDENADCYNGASVILNVFKDSEAMVGYKSTLGNMQTQKKYYGGYDKGRYCYHINFQNNKEWKSKSADIVVLTFNSKNMYIQFKNKVNYLRSTIKNK